MNVMIYVLLAVLAVTGLQTYRVDSLQGDNKELQGTIDTLTSSKSICEASLADHAKKGETYLKELKAARVEVKSIRTKTREQVAALMATTVPSEFPQASQWAINESTKIVETW